MQGSGLIMPCIFGNPVLCQEWGLEFGGRTPNLSLRPPPTVGKGGKLPNLTMGRQIRPHRLVSTPEKPRTALKRLRSLTWEEDRVSGDTQATKNTVGRRAKKNSASGCRRGARGTHGHDYPNRVKVHSCYGIGVDSRCA